MTESATSMVQTLLPNEILKTVRYHLKNGDHQLALLWLKKIDDSQIDYLERRNNLLLSIYTQLNDISALHQAAWQIFKANRNIKTLRNLLSIIGNNQQANVLNSEIAIINECTNFSITDALFLVDIKKITAAESYLLSHINQIDPREWRELHKLAERLEKHKAYLGYTVIYRILLQHIFDLALTRNYARGRRYLRKLGEISQQISHWQTIADHSSYVDELYEKYENRKSFWRND